MGQRGKQRVSGMRHQDWAHWRHLVLKLRWIGLEDEARRLQFAVSTMHLKAEIARQTEPEWEVANKIAH